jgi:hypothetical protein
MQRMTEKEAAIAKSMAKARPMSSSVVSGWGCTLRLASEDVSPIPNYVAEPLQQVSDFLRYTVRFRDTPTAVSPSRQLNIVSSTTTPESTTIVISLVGCEQKLGGMTLDEFAKSVDYDRTQNGSDYSYEFVELSEATDGSDYDRPKWDALFPSKPRPSTKNSKFVLTVMAPKDYKETLIPVCGGDRWMFMCRTYLEAEAQEMADLLEITLPGREPEPLKVEEEDVPFLTLADLALAN